MPPVETSPGRLECQGGSASGPGPFEQSLAVRATSWPSPLLLSLLAGGGRGNKQLSII